MQAEQLGMSQGASRVIKKKKFNHKIIKKVNLLYPSDEYDMFCNYVFGEQIPDTGEFFSGKW